MGALGGPLKSALANVAPTTESRIARRRFRIIFYPV
jgi:hypothetical protein